MTMKPQVAVCGAFDDTSSRTVRFLQEAARFGEVNALVWSDEAVCAAAGKPPKFPQAERLYFLRAVRYVKQALPLHGGADPDTLPQPPGFKPDAWAVDEPAANIAKQNFCGQQHIQYRVFSAAQLQGFPAAKAPSPKPNSTRKKVIVTGSFDWFHSGHVRFFEEVSALGDLYAIVGHDANIRLLKGEGHPLFSEEERLYLVQSIRFVTGAMISTGNGWLDAEPEILRLKPDIYAVNEDGDKGGKREYCEQHGIEYVVLKRVPAPGLPGRSSTQLRGF
jgi:cytidyltransferase-like protein